MFKFLAEIDVKGFDGERKVVKFLREMKGVSAVFYGLDNDNVIGIFPYRNARLSLGVVALLEPTVKKTDREEMASIVVFNADDIVTVIDDGGTDEDKRR